MFDNGGARAAMRGLVVHRFGDWREAAVEDLLPPAPGAGEVLIASEACALNFQDLLLVEGKYQFRPPLPFVAGRDVAGKIVAIGPGVKTFAVGDRVAAQLRYGAFASLALAPVERCFPIPATVDARVAAAAGTIFATAAVALTMRAQLRAGERILISGAAGGVGIAAIQYARHLSATVIGVVSSPAKVDAARRVGVDHVIQIDHVPEPKALRQMLAVQSLEPVDVVLDTVGGGMFDAALRCLRPGGRAIVVGFASGHIPALKTNYILLKDISVIGSSLENALERRDPYLHHLIGDIYGKVAAGDFSPLITASYPLSQFQDAAELIQSRDAVGKIVLLP
jgi:NADPH2:quinone reductase